MKTKLLLTFCGKTADLPITYEMVKNYSISFNILKASIGYNTEGVLLLELDGSDENISAAVEYLTGKGVNINTFKTHVQIDTNRCVHCGSCTSVCPTEALKTNNANGWLLEFDSKTCIGCNLCVNACPLRVIEPAL